MYIVNYSCMSEVCMHIRVRRICRYVHIHIICTYIYTYVCVNIRTYVRVGMFST